MFSSHPEPPPELGADLELDPEEWASQHTYTLIGSLVVPRPVAWVSTIGADGRLNLAPYSYFNLVADDPPHVMFSSIGAKDTLRNVRDNGEFVVNLAGRGQLGALDKTAESPPDDSSEFDLCGVTAEPSQRVRPPRVAEAKAQLECVLVWHAPAGNGHVVVGRVVHIHVHRSVWSDGRVAPALYDPVVRLSRRYGALSAELTPEEAPADHALAQ
ncbi:flavin reductase family protein [Fodinicola feengrottensis]|uniref:Flavin reductase like domain-containing protein n=1 Tax=Fodinicola feengrottensis TaxID=435914 RepID=A0ABN2IY84_9ACTN|nr:flavin reductase family protein [Fodinicola feengrottensis]